MLALSFFSPGKSLFLEKNEKHYSIFDYKNRHAYKFHAFIIKNDIENISESAVFGFKNSLKAILKCPQTGVKIPNAYLKLIF